MRNPARHPATVRASAAVLGTFCVALAHARKGPGNRAPRGSRPAAGLPPPPRCFLPVLSSPLPLRHTLHHHPAKRCDKQETRGGQLYAGFLGKKGDGPEGEKEREAGRWEVRRACGIDFTVSPAPPPGDAPEGRVGGGGRTRAEVEEHVLVEYVVTNLRTRDAISHHQSVKQ